MERPQSSESSLSLGSRPHLSQSAEQRTEMAGTFFFLLLLLLLLQATGHTVYFPEASHDAVPAAGIVGGLGGISTDACFATGNMHRRKGIHL